jgi:hypothetical protein
MGKENKEWEYFEFALKQILRYRRFFRESHK